jgi:hypothetical protein
VFEAGLDQLGSLSWDSIQSEVGGFTPRCSYDRAGIMWSEPGPRPEMERPLPENLALCWMRRVKRAPLSW